MVPVAALILIIIIGYFGDETNSSTDKPITPEEPVYFAGQDGFLYWSKSQSKILVASSEKACDELMQAINANDSLGLRELMDSGEVWMENPGTKVLVLDITFTRRKVRILSGPNAGKAGWVVTETVHVGPPL